MDTVGDLKARIEHIGTPTAREQKLDVSRMSKTLAVLDAAEAVCIDKAVALENSAEDLPLRPLPKLSPLLAVR